MQSRDAKTSFENMLICNPSSRDSIAMNQRILIKPGRIRIQKVNLLAKHHQNESHITANLLE
jgi:hypothetical protein